MTASPRNSSHVRHSSAAKNQAAVARQPKKQMDGSAVTSPSRDPVNSKETLRRNKLGNS
ncbi:MAG: hypothetical protein QM808_04865 [Steroidobacteraceae bacterium]